MNHRRPSSTLLTVALLGLALPAPAGPGPDSSAEPGPEVHGEEDVGRVFLGGSILIGDGAGSRVEALFVRHGRVVAVGAEKEILARPDARQAERIDLEGATALPGLQDAHGHLETLGRSFEEVDLRGCAGITELVERMAAASTGLADGAWIVGCGWDEEEWELAGPLHHAELTAAVPNRPALCLRVDGGAALVNRTALILADLDSRLDPPPRILGGRVELDEDYNATGLLLGRAIERVRGLLPEPSDADRTRYLLRGQAELLARGVTAIHDMGTDPRFLDVLLRARDAGSLRLRVVSYLDLGHEFGEDDLVGVFRAPDAEDRLAVLGVLIEADGTLGSRSAALLADYDDAPGERGALNHHRAALAQRIIALIRRGLQPAVGAVGDRANREVLDIYASLAHSMDHFRELRPRVEHALVVATKDWPRFPDLGVVPSMQPVLAGSRASWIRDRLGEERARAAFAWRSLVPELGHLAFGSGFPAGSPDPLAGLCALRSQGEEESQRLRAARRHDALLAIAGYTRGAAYAVHQEDRRGRLSPGYWADLTVLDVDPIEADVDELRRAEVLLTVINGEVVFAGS